MRTVQTLLTDKTTASLERINDRVIEEYSACIKRARFGGSSTIREEARDRARQLRRIVHPDKTFND